MPDVLHWLGITKIDKFISMSNMKYDAITESGIAIHERVAIPDCYIPADSRVEIDAKIAAGYFSGGKNITQQDLANTKGRSYQWDEIQH
jgi:GTP cyclohydrolase II